MVITVKLNPREATDLLAALDRAMDTYTIGGKKAKDEVDVHFYEAMNQRAAALHHKLTAAQLKAQ